MRSKELISIPKNNAAELGPFKDSVGNFIVHYAGFFDQGFGHRNGIRAGLELRASDTHVIIRDGKLVGELNYYDIN